MTAKLSWEQKMVERKTASSLLEYEVLKPSDFLHTDIRNYVVTTVAKGMMFSGYSC